MKNYLIPCYDALHTQGSQYLVEDLTEYVQEKGFTVGRGSYEVKQND